MISFKYWFGGRTRIIRTLGEQYIMWLLIHGVSTTVHIAARQPLPGDVDRLVRSGVVVVDHVEGVVGQAVELRGRGHGSCHGVIVEIHRVVVVACTVGEICLHHSDATPVRKYLVTFLEKIFHQF